MSRPHVVVDAAPFCYGPISTTMTVLHELHQRRPNVALTVLANGTVLEFIRPSRDWLNIIEVDTEDTAQLREVESLVRGCSLFVSNTNPVSARWARLMGRPTAYIDTLYWMWDEIDPVVAGCDLYLVQEFDDRVDANQGRLNIDVPNMVRTPPLIRSGPEPVGLGNGVLVSLGGMESSLTRPGVTNDYAHVIVPLIAYAVHQVLGEPPTHVAGRGRVVDALGAEQPIRGWTYGHLSHKDHLERFARSALVMLSPGLTGAYEARAAGRPTVLLLAQNYSQEVQARHILGAPGWSFSGCTWKDVFEDLDLPSHPPEHEAITLLNKAILRFQGDRAAQERYTEFLCEAIAASMIRGSVRPHAGAMAGGGAAAAARIIDLLDRMVTAR